MTSHPTVHLGLLVGGLLRTWSRTDTTLWQIADPSAEEALRTAQSTGTLARVERAAGRYREVAELDESDSSAPALVLADGTRVPLTRVTGSVSPRAEAPQEFLAAVAQGVRHAAETFEFLVLEIGGWDAPAEPYAFFALHVDEQQRQLSTVEVSPPPMQSDLWSQHVTAGEDVVSLSATVSEQALEMAPFYLADAVPGWGLLPWDVALTFGVRAELD